MARDQVNPNGTLGPNEYAGFVAPSRPDASTVGPGGNIFDRAEHTDVMGTKGLDKNQTPAQPLGSRVNKGW